MQSATTGEKSTYTVLVTGANSGLGFSTCCRLIDEFLFTRPQSQSLSLVVTTRDQRKNDDTLLRLRKHLQKTLRDANGRTLGISLLLEPRIQLSGELLDLTSLITVKALAAKLVKRGTRIDVLVLNAGIGGWSGFNWLTAIWTVFTDTVYATTFPTYKLGSTGQVARQQMPASKSAGETTGQQTADAKEPPLGEVFTANVFGHYMLAHFLMPVLTTQPGSRLPPARIIWTSSIEAHARFFDPNDLQGLKIDTSYESSKRLTDVLALTSDLPSTSPYISRYLSIEDVDADSDQQPPKMYLSHPGIVGTSIAGLSLPLHWAMVLLFYFARWFGSPWHNIDPYMGAVSGVWLALASQATLDRVEEEGGKGKWGSSCDRGGNERVIRSEVFGWGWGGAVGEKPDGGMRLSKGRYRDAVPVTKEDKEEFEEAGRGVWRALEEMRIEWEARLGRVDNREDM